MIARGAFGNPYIFDEINSYLKTNTISSPISAKEKLKLAVKHLHMEVEYGGEFLGIRRMRKHFPWYLKGMSNSGKVKIALNKADTVDQILNIINEYIRDYYVEVE